MGVSEGGTGGPLRMRIIWVIVVAILLTTVISIYRFLLPAPNLLAEAVEIELGAGGKYTLEPLPMGGRYRLRACDHATELRSDIGKWSSGWIRLPVNPSDLDERDLLIDGRTGGTLRIQARTPTGRLLLLRARSKATCRGDDPLDLDFATRRQANRLPPFDCEEETLSRYDREGLEFLGSEIRARHGAPLDDADIARFSKARWYKKDKSYNDDRLSEEELSCLERLAKLAQEAPGPGALPEMKPDDAPSPSVEDKRANREHGLP